MNETEEAISSCIEEVLKKSDALQCSTTEQRNVRISEDNEIIESCSNIVVTNSSDVKSTDPDDPVEVKGTCCRVTTPSEPHVTVEDEIIDTCALPHPTTKVFDTNGEFVHEDRGVEQTSKSADETQPRRPTSKQGYRRHAQTTAHEATRNTGWIFQGEHNGYAYYTNNSGQVYSVDRSGYWYIQQENGDFIPYESSLHYANIQLQMFPLNDGGQPTLPSNAQGEKVFPTDANHMPIFPLDPKTNQPTFPVDDTGQPVFPSGVNGRAIVPVDSNGVAIFPRGENGRFIFPSGANGNPVAPVNIYGVPVLPLDSNGKPVIPYDSSGVPLIHLANDVP